MSVTIDLVILCAGVPVLSSKVKTDEITAKHFAKNCQIFQNSPAPLEVVGVSPPPETAHAGIR